MQHPSAEAWRMTAYTLEKVVSRIESEAKLVPGIFSYRIL